MDAANVTQQLLFQSTLPARGATASFAALNPPERFQSTLPARGATELVPDKLTRIEAFQSTLPARGATIAQQRYEENLKAISIHAPRTGSDARGRRKTSGSRISIHAPRTGSDS